MGVIILLLQNALNTTDGYTAAQSKIKHRICILGFTAALQQLFLIRVKRRDEIGAILI